MRKLGYAFVVLLVLAGGIGNVFAPGPIIVIGTGTGGKLTVSVGTTIQNGESSNRVNMTVTYIIGGFVVYEGATGPSHQDSTGLSIRADGEEVARITRVGSQFHWLLADDGGTLAIPEVCEVVNTSANIPDCSSGSAGVPARLINLSSGVSLWATWDGQSDWVEIHHAELQGASQ